MRPDVLRLDGEWQLFYELEETRKAAEPGYDENGIPAGLPRITAEVPGNTALDLARCGKEADPFYGSHIYDYKKYEYSRFWYVKHFELEDEPAEDEEYYLQFEGIDTIARIRLNGTELGTTENMFISHSFPVHRALKYCEDNVLVVEFLPVLEYARRRRYPVNIFTAGHADERVGIRKAAHSFGWDIAPRFLLPGIWRSVCLTAKKRLRIDEVYLSLNAAEGKHGEALFRYRLQAPCADLGDLKISIRGRCEESEFSAEQPVRFISDGFSITVDNLKRWWPRGYGSPHLYETEIALIREGKQVDLRREMIGFRSVELVTDYSASEEEQDFRIRINGTEIFAKGTNWVPLDAFHSRDAARLGRALDLLLDCGCNMVRCWGGNVYEDHAFFDYCDRNGIMVWQDFAFACAAYPQDDTFAELVEREAESVIVKLRNHPSIILWCGDNEVDQMYYNNGYRLPHAYYNRISRELLFRSAGVHDPYRPYIPSSPFIPEAGRSHLDVPEQHNWGPRDYFKGDFYRLSTASFISEIGYHGCPALGSLRLFIPEEELTDFTGESLDTHNTDYLRHIPRRYNRNDLMKSQVEIFFGEVPASLERFIMASQISQAEAKKFFIESARLNRPKRTGVLWWNLLDCWPQISDAVCDYYYEKKLAYYYIQRVQSEVCVMMAEPENWTYRIYADNCGSRPRKLDFQIKDGTKGGVLLSGSIELAANRLTELGRLGALPGEQRLFIMDWDSEGSAGGNHYVSGFVPFPLSEYETWLPIIEELSRPFKSTDCFR